MAEMSDNRHSIVKRLKRIEGQVKGLVRMLEDDRYCIDILHQIQATKAALTKAETVSYAKVAPSFLTSQCAAHSSPLIGTTEGKSDQLTNQLSPSATVRDSCH